LLSTLWKWVVVGGKWPQLCQRGVWGELLWWWSMVSIPCVYEEWLFLPKILSILPMTIASSHCWRLWTVTGGHQNGSALPYHWLKSCIC
jgi:hypothetical protein